MSSPDKHLEQRARALFLAASEQLDPTTAGKLRAARRTAMGAARQGQRAARLLLPAGAFAALALVALMMWQPHHHTAPPAAPVALSSPASADVDSDLPPDPDSADPTLYQNLDFYGWLAANDRAGQRKH